MKKLIYLVLGLLVFMTGCTTSNTANKISPEQLKKIKFLDTMQLNKLFVGQTVEGLSLKKQSKFSFTYKNDGTFSAIVRNGKKTITGTWTIKDGTKCNTYKSGRTSCSKYYKEGDKYFSLNKEKMTLNSYFKVKR